MEKGIETQIIKEIASQIRSCDTSKIIQPVRIGEGSSRNELVFFIKPELLEVDNIEHIESALTLVSTKFAQFDAKADGIVIVSGNTLAEKQIMDRHYGFINRLSRSASKLLDDTERRKIAEALELSSANDYEILGGHEYLKRYPGEDYAELDRLWFSKKSLKLRSGFYVQAYESHNSKIILVNGFHPAQLHHFTNPTHRILLILLHSNNNWKTLRNEMVGATFPEKATPESIRGTLHANPNDFGLENVTIANNGVHLSAGPFEALFEIQNFFGNLFGTRPEKTPPLLVLRMLQSGIDMSDAIRTAENPSVRIADRLVDLFASTEDYDSDEAIALWKGTR